MRPEIIRNLGDGLVLRRASAADAEPLAAFQGEVHRDPSSQGPDEYVMAWTRDLMTRPHPTFRPADFALVEDTDSGAIASAACLISQTWTYGGIPFGVGRPELIGTHPDYRRRGMVRAQMEVIHEWSAARGERMQAITGIPYYYRQFGYEMCLHLGGGRSAYKPQMPKLKEGEKEAYRLRPAGETDLPFIAELCEQGDQRYAVACLRDEAQWRNELAGKSERNIIRRELIVIEKTDGEPVGFLGQAGHLWRNHLSVLPFEVKAGVSWLAVAPSVVRALWRKGEAMAKEEPEQEMTSLFFWLGVEHPLFDVAPSLLPHTRPSYAWYVRVADLPGFIQHVAPVLEQRLAASPLVGHSGELFVSFYRSGLRLAFEAGRLTQVEPWQPTVEKGGDAAFPDLTFLQLLVGYRSLSELRYAFADCWVGKDEARTLLEVLFPSKPSYLWPVA
jgi:GNAT superfamily N-acetyltransferase